MSGRTLNFQRGLRITLNDNGSGSESKSGSTLNTVGYGTVRYETVGYEAVGYETIRVRNGRDTERSKRSGCETVGYETVGYETIGCETVAPDRHPRQIPSWNDHTRHGFVTFLFFFFFFALPTS